MGIKTLQYGIGQAKGLYQGVDDNLLNMAYSPDCQNIDVSDGIVSTRKGSAVVSVIEGSTVLPYTCRKTISVPARIGTSTEFVYVSVYGTVDGSTYRWYYAGEADGGEEELKEIAGLSTISPAYCDTLQYLISGDPYEIVFGTAAVVKLSAAQNAHGYWVITAAALGGTPPTGSMCTLHRERMWVVSGNNEVTYSNAYDPEDWSTAGETGAIDIITYDADSIVGIANWLDDVIIFKKNTMHIVQGDTPDEYEVSQIYSGRGAIDQKSIVTDGVNCFFASTDGIYQYDGTQCSPILTTEIKDTFAAMQSIKLTIDGNKLYVWDLYNASGYVGKHLVYDIREKTVEVLNVGTVYEAHGLAYSAGTRIFVLNQTSLTFGLDFGGTAITAYWITPENDCQYPNAEKSLDHICFNGWGTTSAGAAGGQVKITIYYNLNGTQKTKERTVTLSTTRRYHEVQADVTGRLFKYKIENVNGSAINISGFTPVYEVDEA
jgi:hypothetical protein